MSTLAPETSPLAGTMTAESAPTTTEKLRLQWRQRIQEAKDARFPFERTMLSDLAFAAGQHWLVYDDHTRSLRRIQDVDPRYTNRELYTADRITEYRMAQLGELESDDDLPTLLVVQDGETAEDAASQLNAAVAYAWEHEWQAEEVLSLARRYCLDMGVAAIRCRWDPDKGGKLGDAPVDQAGEPLEPDEIMHLTLTGATSDGSLPKFKPVREGATTWEAYSALHLLTPPGVTHERYFPWEVLARPVPVDTIKDLYPHLASSLREDGDIANLTGVLVGQETRTGQRPNRLRNHAWLYTCFARPCAAYPNGSEVVLASNQMLLAEQKDQFDYVQPDGTPHSGVVYLHWWRRSDRFWSGSFVAPLKDPQRIINRRETQNVEIIDRGMPRTYIKKGDLPEYPTGAPQEIVEMDQQASTPIFNEGSGPGPWMYQDLAHQAENLGHASTVAALRLGENPTGVDTYSQLALLNDNESSKRVTVMRDHRRQVATLVELGVYDIRRYWPDEKRILVAGPESQIERMIFQKSRIPDFFMATVAPGAPAPRSQGAQLKMLDSIWAAAVQAWVAVQDGQAWVEWYSDSVKAGKPLDLPGAKSETQRDLAYYENQQMQQGDQPQVMDYDVLPVHLPVHREAQDQARASGDAETAARIVQHIQDHMEMIQANQARQAAVAAGAPAAATPLPPGAPGSAVPVGAPPAGGASFPQFPGFQLRPREPQPQEIGHAFGQLAQGQ